MGRPKQAVIVAAGVGSRLRPYINDCPKAMIEINGQTIIHRSIELLLKHGIEEVIVVVGYRKEMLMAHLKDYPVRFVYNPFYKITNNMASLWFASPWLEHDFIYAHSDLIFDGSLLKALVKSPHETVLLVEEKLCGKEEMKVIAKDGVLVESSKSLAPEDCLGEWTGIARFAHAFTQTLMSKIGRLLEGNHLQDYDTLALSQLAREGETIHILTFKDTPWVEIDTEADLQSAREIFSG